MVSPLAHKKACEAETPQAFFTLHSPPEGRWVTSWELQQELQVRQQELQQEQQ